MSVKKIFIAVIFTSISLTSFSQKIFREGYITRNNDEVITGLVEYTQGKSIAKECVFKRFEIASEIKYNADQIKNFGYQYGSKYESINNSGKNEFYEVLVSGEINLYKKGSKYYLTKNKNNLIELSDGPIEYIVNNEKRKSEDLVSFLQIITDNKIDIGEKIILKDIVPVISAFNKKAGNSYQVFNNSFSKKSLMSASFRAGKENTGFGITTSLYSYSLLLQHFGSDFVPVFDSRQILYGGLTWEKLLSGKDDHVKLRIDLLFTKQHLYSYSEKELSSINSFRDDSFLEFSALKLPVTIQYSFTSGRIVPFTGAGISYSQFLSHSYLHVRETQAYSYIYTSEDRNLVVRNGEFSFLFTGGLKIRILNEMKLSIQAGIEIGQGLFTRQNLYKVRSSQTFIQIGLTR
jgi:hypothetical protein